MARIRVNPENLIQKSADLTVAAVGLRGLSDDVKNSAESAPSYDGQFGPLVSALGFSALISGKKRAESIADHSSDLVQRASAFLAADTSDSRVIATIPEILTSQLIWLRLLAALMGLTVAQLLLLLRLGLLRGPFWMFPWGILPYPPRFPRFPWPRPIWPWPWWPKLPKPWWPPIIPGPKVPPEPIKPISNDPPVIVDSGVSIVNNDGAYISRGYEHHIADTGSKAIDIAVKDGNGTQINASYTGKVVFSSDKGMVNGDGYHNPPEGGWLKLAYNYGHGNLMIVEYAFDDQPVEVQKMWQEAYGMKPGQSIYAAYSHLDTGSLLPANTLVQPGDKIAGVGSSGNSTGPHIHLALKVQNSGSLKNESNWDLAGFNNWGGSVNPEKLDQFLPNKDPVTNQTQEPQSS